MGRPSSARVIWGAFMSLLLFVITRGDDI